ncbi:MAG: TldD/PmbA family protein, partial [candidate division KSB1 bacterium]|nr:TldD/PmbA family protein [candidate division KSB1 bacterium]
TIIGGTALGMAPAMFKTLWSDLAREAPGDELLVPEEILKKAVALLMSKGADFGDIYVERAIIEGIQSDDRKINTSTLIDKGVGVRAVKDGKTFYAYTDSLKPDEIYRTARFVADAAASGTQGTPGLIADLSRQTSKLKFPFVIDPATVSIDNKVELVQKLTDRAWSADKRVTQVSQLYREITRHVTLATSSGKLIQQTLGLTEFYATTYMKDKEGNLQRGRDGRAAYAGREFFQGKNSLEAIVDKSIQRASNLLEAVDSPRGVFPVVLGPGGNGVIFHESCGHGMEADLVFKGSNFKDQLGKQTAAKGVTLIDDGTLPQMPGSFAFDDEGTPSQRTILIEDGIQQNYLCDLIWAQKLGLQSTGSGRRQSFRYPPIPRMRNTFIDKGNVSPEDIISNTKRGIYVAEAGGGQVDPVTGNFMMGVTEGYLIENGQITRPIKGATLSGMGIEALKTIDLVGQDLEIQADAGRCGKMQSVPVGCGMPTIRVRGILVGGKGQAWEDKQGGAS